MLHLNSVNGRIDSDESRKRHGEKRLENKMYLVNFCVLPCEEVLGCQGRRLGAGAGGAHLPPEPHDPEPHAAAAAHAHPANK